MTLSEESSKPFTRAEVRLILSAADNLSHRDRHGAEDPYFYGHLARVLLTFGVHPSSLPAALSIQKRPTERGDRFYLVWIRPKVQAKRRQIEVEVPASMVDWLPAFVNAEKPRRRETYWHLMKDVQREVERRGYTILLCPRRFRHTCARELVARGVSMTDVRAMLGVTQEILDAYALSTPEQRGEKAESIRWGDW